MVSTNNDGDVAAVVPLNASPIAGSDCGGTTRCGDGMGHVSGELDKCDASVVQSVLPTFAPGFC